jgi:hypothetical protein
LGAGLSEVVVLPGSTSDELKVDMNEEFIRRIEGQNHSMAAKLSARSGCRSAGIHRRIRRRVWRGGG